MLNKIYKTLILSFVFHFAAFAGLYEDICEHYRRVIVVLSTEVIEGKSMVHCVLNDGTVWLIEDEQTPTFFVRKTGYVVSKHWKVGDEVTINFETGEKPGQFVKIWNRKYPRTPDPKIVSAWHESGLPAIAQCEVTSLENDQYKIQITLSDNTTWTAYDKRHDFVGKVKEQIYLKKLWQIGDQILITPLLIDDTYGHVSLWNLDYSSREGVWIGCYLWVRAAE